VIWHERKIPHPYGFPVFNGNEADGTDNKGLAGSITTTTTPAVHASRRSALTPRATANLSEGYTNDDDDDDGGEASCSGQTNDDDDEGEGGGDVR